MPPDQPAFAGRSLRARRLLAGLVILAFGLCLVHVLTMSRSPYFGVSPMDLASHVDWARA